MRNSPLRHPPTSPGHPDYWRRLRPGARIVVRTRPSVEEQAATAVAHRRELEVVAVRHVAVPDERGRLQGEYVIFDLRSREAPNTLIVSVAGARVAISVFGALENGSAASREELAQLGWGWIFEDGPAGPEYARYPSVPVVEGGHERRLPFAATFGGPLRGEYAAPGSDRAATILIMEYAALEPCDDPILVVLEEVDTGRVTVLSGNRVDPAQFER